MVCTILQAAYLETDDAVRRKATGHPDVIKALFGLLWESKTLPAALTQVHTRYYVTPVCCVQFIIILESRIVTGVIQILSMMCTKPVSDTDKAAKKSLYVVYIKTLRVAQAQAGNTQYCGLISSLLMGIQQVRGLSAVHSLSCYGLPVQITTMHACCIGRLCRPSCTPELVSTRWRYTRSGDAAELTLQC